MQSMTSAVMAAILALGVSVAAQSDARAESLGLWRYTAPQGFEVVKKATQHEYKRIDGKTFCLLAVYVPRPAGASLEADVKEEWAKIVGSGFTATDATAVTAAPTKQGLTKHTRSARLTSEAGTFHGQLVVLREQGAVGSVMTLSNSAQTIGTCLPAVAAVTDSIATSAGAAGATSTAVPARSLVGQWGVDTALRQHNADNWMYGYVRFQYDLRADASYSFRKEVKLEGTPKTTFDSYSESGTYRIDGTNVTITPKLSTHIKRDLDGKVLQSDKVALEKVTYTWRQDPVESNNETLLILTPGKATMRDGSPNGGSYAPGGYILSNRKKLEWKF